MGGANHSDVLSGENRKAVFEGYKSHNDGRRTCTELVMLETIRQSHPDFHVTRTSPRQCDFAGFANAGLANMSLATDENYEFSRNYKAPGPRLEGKPGVLWDNVTFGQWNYEWKEFSFIIYEVQYRDDVHSPPTKLCYFLSPRCLITEGEPTPTDKVLLAVGAWSSELHDEIYVFDDGRWTKNRELWKSVHGSSWDDVILNPDMKTKIISDVQGFFDNRALYKNLAVPWKRGLILHGVPGNGKTISIKALIAELSKRTDPVPSLYVKSFDACQGQKYSIRNIFTQARTMAPCLLIFEDLDSLVTDENRSYFLNEVDGLESNDGILMIGSTNHLDSLDPAISKRPSRFDRKYHFKLPDEDERSLYAEFWRRKLAGNELVEFPGELCGVIARLAEGFSFAYLKELFVIALLTIARGASVDEEVEFRGGVSDDGKSWSTETPVLVEHEASTSEGKEEVPPPHEELEAEAAPRKRLLPQVDTPESLKYNVLLRVIRAQIKILHEEMDNTNEKNWPSSKKPKDGKRSGKVARPMCTMQAQPMDAQVAQLFNEMAILQNA